MVINGSSSYELMMAILQWIHMDRVACKTINCSKNEKYFLQHKFNALTLVVGKALGRVGK